METASKSSYRVRIQHTHTIKDGWRLSETTVEATGEEIDYFAIKAHLEHAWLYGIREAQERNHQEVRVT